MTRIFRPLARSATMEPILPAPIRPSTLPVISTPMKRFFSHLPAWVEALAAGSSRASASISEMACSAVVMELPKGVFITITPAAVAAGNIDIVDADAGAADDLQLLGGLDHLGGDLGGRADGDAVILIDDREQFFLGHAGLMSASTPRSLKMATAAGESLSAIRTLGMEISMLEFRGVKSRRDNNRSAPGQD